MRKRNETTSRGKIIVKKLLARLNPFGTGVFVFVMVYLAVQSTTGNPAREETIIAIVLAAAAGVWVAFKIYKAREET